MPLRSSHTVALLSVVTAATLAAGSLTVADRTGRRAFCSSGRVQYEFVPAGFFVLNSYADVHERLCLTPHRASPQFVDVRLRVTVQMETRRNALMFEPDSTWAEVEVTTEGRVTTHRCDFPELSRMTPYLLTSGQMGHEGALAKDCRFDVPRAGRVSVRLRFHAVERSGDHTPLSGPLSVHRDTDGTHCFRGIRAESCERVDL